MSATVLFSEESNGVSITFMTGLEEIVRLQSMQDSFPAGVSFSFRDNKVCLDIAQREPKEKLWYEVTMEASKFKSFLNEESIHPSECLIASLSPNLVTIWFWK